ncbi:MAG: electron transfer flavoprotein subunit alpha/FixB family protein [Fimbriimonas sp.]
MSRLLVIVFDPNEASLGFAEKLGIPFDVLCLRGDLGTVGAENLFLANLPAIPPADGLAKALAAFSAPYSHVAAVSSMQSKDVLPRVAALLDGAMVTDVVALESERTFRRPIVAGALFETIEITGAPIVLTYRPAGFSTLPAETPANRSEVELEITSRVNRTSSHGGRGGRPDLTQAKRIVSGGRPLRDAATFEQVLGGLADVLGGAVGATRAAVDSGIAPNELQVGQTGKIVAPDLYIAAGISGSTQHMAGIKDSKVIVAINKDPDAPIFDIADFGLVADLFQAVPELTEKLKA